MNGRLSARVWSALLPVGLTGRFARTIENMYLNVFLCNTISQDPGCIAAALVLVTIPIPVLALRKRDAALSTLSGEQRAEAIGGTTAIFMTQGKEKNAGE